MFSEKITRGKTFGHLFTSGHNLPESFINATILRAQTPFVFTQDYLDHYQVKRFGSNDWTSDEWQTAWNKTRSLSDVPLGYAASISGSVPPWYYGYANTGICEDNSLGPSSFCNAYLGDDGAMSGLHIVDGGLYDNFGMNTIIELFSGLNYSPETKRAVIFIDTTTSIQPHLNANVSGRSAQYSKAKGVRDSMGFPARDAIYSRLRDPVFSALNTKTIVLDLYSTEKFDPIRDAHFIDGSEKYSALTRLENYARSRVSCFTDDRKALRAYNKWFETLMLRNEASRTQAEREVSGDCLANNYYRTGTAMKTSYLADEELFTVMWQLGQLAVRINADKITDALKKE